MWGRLMSEQQASIDAAMLVLDDFMSSLNASDEAGVNRSFNFPHVRFTGGGDVKVFIEPGDYKLSYFRERTEADGWHCSDWDRRDVIHAGPSKVHLDTQFSRYRADGSIIGSYTSIYITTFVGNKWGIQARSSYAL
jgi:hypothetical protein